MKIQLFWDMIIVQIGKQSLELLCTTLKMETVHSSETLTSKNQSECHIPEDIYLQGYIQSRTNGVTALIR